MSNVIPLHRLRPPPETSVARYAERQHPMAWGRAGAALILALALFGSGNGFAVALALLFGLWGLARLLTPRASLDVDGGHVSITTPYRVYDLERALIERVDYIVPPFGALFNYGTVVFRGRAGRIKLKAMPDLPRLRAALRQG